MISTKKIQLTSKEYFKTIITIYFKKKWWLIALFWLVAIIIFFSDKRDSLGNFIMLFAIIYPLIIIFQYWNYVHSKDNKIFLLERYYEIYEDKIIGILDDGSETTINIDKFIKVIQLKNIYLLYISKDQFIYITKNSFKNQQDKDWFEKEVFSKI